MANEIIKTSGASKGAVVLPEFNTSGDEPRRLKISVKSCKTKDGKKKFKAVKGYMKISTLDADGNVVKNGVRKIDVHFTMNAFKDSPLSSIDDLASGYLYVYASGLQLPAVYQVTKDEDGKDKYPAIWIKSGILGLEKFYASQASLDVDEDATVVDADTTDADEEADEEADDEANEEFDEANFDTSDSE